MYSRWAQTAVHRSALERSCVWKQSRSLWSCLLVEWWMQILYALMMVKKATIWRQSSKKRAWWRRYLWKNHETHKKIMKKIPYCQRQRQRRSNKKMNKRQTSYEVVIAVANSHVAYANTTVWMCLGRLFCCGTSDISFWGVMPTTTTTTTKKRQLFNLIIITLNSQRSFKIIYFIGAKGFVCTQRLCCVNSPLMPFFRSLAWNNWIATSFFLLLIFPSD